MNTVASLPATWRDIAKIAEGEREFDEAQIYRAVASQLEAALATLAVEGGKSNTMQLASEIAVAVASDEQDGGCDLSAGMFGPAMSALIRRLATPEQPGSAVQGEAVAWRWRAGPHLWAYAGSEAHDWHPDEAEPLYTTPPPAAAAEYLTGTSGNQSPRGVFAPSAEHGLNLPDTLEQFVAEQRSAPSLPLEPMMDDAQPEARGVEVPEQMYAGDPRNPLRDPILHDGYTAGFNACRKLWLAATPNPARGVEGMVPRDALDDLYRAYVRLLESGRDRIMELGGTCDPVDVMEHSDPFLVRARRALAAAPNPVRAEQGEGKVAWKEAILSRLREVLGPDGTVYRDVKAMLAAAPNPVRAKQPEVQVAWIKRLLPNELPESDEPEAINETPYEEGYDTGWNSCLREIRKRLASAPVDQTGEGT